MAFTALSKYFMLACVFMQAVASSQPKTVIYWGQESDGKEKPLRDYCSSGDYDIIVLGFAYEFPTPSTHSSDYPALNFASHCETPYNSDNPQLLICPAIGADITYCQQLGVQILLSFGGGVGRYGFSSDSQAVAFATTVWNMFFEGTGLIRPFGNAIIDGVDLDIEGGSTTGYVAFINKLRSYYSTSSRNYFISSAPQCFYPDGRLGPGTGTALTDGWMDYVFVQFYNNYCGLEFTPYLATPQFNFDTWGKWARTGSVNPNVKIFVGAPASSRAAAAGFVTMPVLQSMVTAAATAYPDVYGGIMVWDCSNSDNNNNYGHSVAAFVRSQRTSLSIGSSSSSSSVATPSTPTSPSTTGRVVIAPTPAPTPVPVQVPVTPITTSRMAQIPSLPPVVPLTTGSVKPVTTASVPVVSVPPVAVVPKPVGSTSTSSSSSSTTCTAGNMKCLTSETYSMCDRGRWNAAQSCQVGLTCTPSGNFIYCT